MNRIAVLVLCGLATVAALFTTIWPHLGNQGIDGNNGFGQQTSWLSQEPFPPALSQKVFPIGLATNIASRQVQMDKDDRYQEYVFDTFSNGDKGTLFFNERGVLAEITMEYAATKTKAWFRLGKDGATIMEKRTTDLVTGALLEEGERGDDNRFVLRTYVPGATQIARIRTYESRGMILNGGLGGINLIARDQSFYPNDQVEYLFVASDVLNSERFDYAKDGKATAYLKIMYRARLGWFFYPDGVTKRMAFERKNIMRDSVGYWEVHTDYFDPEGVLEAKRVFTRSAMIVTVDLLGIGNVRQTWGMVLPHKAEAQRLVKDNFVLSFVELDSYNGLKDVRFTYKDGVLTEFWYQTKLATSEQVSGETPVADAVLVQVRLTLDPATGAVISKKVVDLKTQKELVNPELVDVSTGPIKAPAGLTQMLDYEPPPAVPFEPDYPQGEH